MPSGSWFVLFLAPPPLDAPPRLLPVPGVDVDVLGPAVAIILWGKKRISELNRLGYEQSALSCKNSNKMRNELTAASSKDGHKCWLCCSQYPMKSDDLRTYVMTHRQRFEHITSWSTLLAPSSAIRCSQACSGDPKKIYLRKYNVYEPECYIKNIATIVQETANNPPDIIST